MQYLQLFELNIIHNYYREKICPDLSIEPTNECSKILNGHRLIIKNKFNGIVVIAPVDSENKPWIELNDNLQFTFILKLINKDFLDFTDIHWKPIDNNIYNFSNQKNNEIGASELEVDITKLSDQNLSQGQNILGIVNIYNNSSMPQILNHKCEYKITFKAKKQKWRYYLVTDNVNNGDEFLIEDNDTNSDKAIKFIKSINTETEKTDPIFSVLNQQFPQSQKYLFQSESEIACQQEGRKNIQLLNKKNGKSSDVWIEHLPNPPNRSGIQIINALKYL